MAKYKRYQKLYHDRPSERVRNKMRHRARRLLIKTYGKAKLAGKDIHHKDRNPNNNSRSNLSIKPRTYNRSKNK